MTIRSHRSFDESQQYVDRPEAAVLVDRSPERDAKLHAENPNLMSTWLERGSRSDGGNRG